MRKEWASLPEEHCLRQSLIDIRGFVEVQVSRREIPAHSWSIKIYI